VECSERVIIVNKNKDQNRIKIVTLETHQFKIMEEKDVISKELISHLIMLEESQQNKVLVYIKSLLQDQANADMNRRAEASEKDIAAGRVKPATIFKQEFEMWKKHKRSMKS
jgi:hypothetical protein